ncbi:MAG TPA: glucan biosynthesis protein, partial [Nevskiaceae bacterium]|nr:glucan biosynthesis protein [Nevskiaceae bacterium]
KPGDSTNIDVQERLFMRERMAKLEIAPLSSMYFFGENSPAHLEDYRPEVHDSEGLQVQTDHEWIWRPLVNPKRVLITAFGAINPRGFGLMQRDRNFAHYEDLEARYDLRPSCWITPKNDWGPGRVELTLLPTPDETNDNVVAYWVPDNLPAPGQPIDLQYTLSWQMKNETRPTMARVVQTRRGHGWWKDDDGSMRFNVDFEGGDIAKLAAANQIVAGVWVGENGELMERQSYRNDVTGGWRVSLRIRREEEDRPVEMRVVLRDPKGAISETWAYILPARTAPTD